MRIFIEHLPPTPESAFYRAHHPESWWYTPEIAFLAKILVTGQWANWQRGGGNGEKPKEFEPPSDKPIGVNSATELEQRKTAMRAEMERRRALKRKVG